MESICICFQQKAVQRAHHLLLVLPDLPHGPHSGRLPVLGRDQRRVQEDCRSDSSGAQGVLVRRVEAVLRRGDLRHGGTDGHAVLLLDQATRAQCNYREGKLRAERLIY